MLLAKKHAVVLGGGAFFMVDTFVTDALRSTRIDTHTFWSTQLTVVPRHSLQRTLNPRHFVVDKFVTNMFTPKMYFLFLNCYGMILS